MAFDPYADGQGGPFVIAEIGINHNGSVDVAKKLVDMAKSCGADAVKFQKRTIDIVYGKEILDAFRESPWGSTVREQKEGLELSKSEYDEIDDYCREKEIYWSASAWDEKSQKFLNNYGLGFNKIASAMATHKKLLEMVAKEGKHTFISTGMCTFEQLDRAVRRFEKERCPFTLLHCVSTYPCPDGLCNIERIETLRKRYQCPIGYSGHETGVLPSILAASLGAATIERHITLDRSMYGSDQSFSLEAKGLSLLIRDLRRIHKILKSDLDAITREENKIAHKLRYFRESDFDWSDL